MRMVTPLRGGATAMDDEEQLRDIISERGAKALVRLNPLVRPSE